MSDFKDLIKTLSQLISQCEKDNAFNKKRRLAFLHHELIKARNAEDEYNKVPAILKTNNFKQNRLRRIQNGITKYDSFPKTQEEEYRQMAVMYIEPSSKSIVPKAVFYAPPAPAAPPTPPAVETALPAAPSVPVETTVPAVESSPVLSSNKETALSSPSENENKSTTSINMDNITKPIESIESIESSKPTEPIELPNGNLKWTKNSCYFHSSIQLLRTLYRYGGIKFNEDKEDVIKNYIVQYNDEPPTDAYENAFKKIKKIDLYNIINWNYEDYGGPGETIKVILSDTNIDSEKLINIVMNDPTDEKNYDPTDKKNFILNLFGEPINKIPKRDGYEPISIIYATRDGGGHFYTISKHGDKYYKYDDFANKKEGSVVRLNDFESEFIGVILYKLKDTITKGGESPYYTNESSYSPYYKTPKISSIDLIIITIIVLLIILIIIVIYVNNSHMNNICLTSPHTIHALNWHHLASRI
jgi:hypothetical protein